MTKQTVAHNKFHLVLDVLFSDHVIIDCFGDSGARAVWSYFTRRHPKLPVFRLKTFGASLRSVPLDPEEIASGGSYELMRRKVRKARKAGFTFRQMDPLAHFEEIMEINNSASERNGAKMTADYVDPQVVRAEMVRPDDWYGVFGPDRVLRAYAYVPVFGEAFVFWKILGHHAYLDHGLVYLLVHDTFLVMGERRRQDGYPVWGMYDMYIGGPDGLRDFKRRTGFRPRRVKWRWVDHKLDQASSRAFTKL